MPTCTTPIRATAPWRAAADSIRARTACSSMELSNGAARLTTSAVAIAPSHHRRLRVRNVNIHARMPQPDRAPAVGRLQVADGVGQVCCNRALRVDRSPCGNGSRLAGQDRRRRAPHRPKPVLAVTKSAPRSGGLLDARGLAGFGIFESSASRSTAWCARLAGIVIYCESTHIAAIGSSA
jgi:hypothetical protein